MEGITANCRYLIWIQPVEFARKLPNDPVTCIGQRKHPRETLLRPTGVTIVDWITAAEGVCIRSARQANRVLLHERAAYRIELPRAKLNHSGRIDIPGDKGPRVGVKLALEGAV